MKKLLVMSLLILVVGNISAAYAVCYRDGRPYPTGTVIDGFVCTESGKWVRV